MSGDNGRRRTQIDCQNLFDDETEPQWIHFEPFNDIEEEGVVTPRAPQGQPLKVEKVDLMKEENTQVHKTSRYETPDLVLRRGFQFTLKITFDRPITDQDHFQVQFRIGAHPHALKKTLVSLSFLGMKSSGPWTHTASQQQGVLTLQVTPAPTAVIGKYRTVVGVEMNNGLQFTPKHLSPSLYLLFNAYNSEDVAHLENQSDCEAYVMADTGGIYMGNYPDVSEKPWNFGQFESGVLDACIFIMDKSQLPISDRGDAVKVCRMASAMINSLDDLGVLEGNWGDDFSSGESPTFWTGSVRILLQYKERRVPVKYAQCWVFAGVLNTFLRCMGLAARVITNFFSAHDNDGNLVTDLVLDSSMDLDMIHSKDSIWNFHCWNEVFLRRSDIPAEFSGWQVIDSTPQEMSDGNFRCGPSSVKAIKIGKVCYPFDSRFIFAEVNSDVVYRVRNKYGEMRVVYIDKKKVGAKILTQHAQRGALDVTLDYKYHEEYEADKNEEALATAESFNCTRDHTEVPPTPLIIRIHIEKTYLGRTVKAQVEFENTSDSQLHIRVLVKVETVFYTGLESKLILREHRNQDLPPNHSQKMDLVLHPNQYMAHVGPQPMLKITIRGQPSHGTIVTESRSLTLEVLGLTLEVSPADNQWPITVGKKAMVKVTFTNSLDVPLVRPRVGLEGPGLMPFTDNFFQNVEPGRELVWNMEFYPYQFGNKRLTAIMASQNNYMAWGSVEVRVAPRFSGWSGGYGPYFGLGGPGGYGRYPRSEAEAED